MVRYTCDPNLEVSGVTTLSFVQNISSETFSHLLEKHQLTEIDTSKWYPVQQIFDLFNDIAWDGNTQPFVAMGMQIAEQSEFPPEMKNNLTLIGILEGWQAHYAANHRGADLPPTQTIKLRDTHYQIVLKAEHLYPFDLVYGMAFGFCRLLLPTGAQFTVQYDNKHSPYNDDFGDKVVINVSWSIPE